MPQASDYLRAKFMSGGIQRCREILISEGCTVEKATVRYVRDLSPLGNEAMQYLVQEWDFDAEIIPSLHPSWDSFVQYCANHAIGDVTVLAEEDWRDWWDIWLTAWECGYAKTLL